ncbi:MAG: PaaI family thioesterase, partial [Burkholderiales bacterium]
MSAIPPGFAKLDSTSPFHELVGPLYEKRDGRTVTIGLLVAEKHKNRRGIVHGGMICTLVDFAMGHAASTATGAPRKLVTTTLA